MIVDCSTCTVRGDACAGCVVSLLFGSEPGVDVPWHGPGVADLLGGVQDSSARRPVDDVDRAIAMLARAGMLSAEDMPVGMTLTSPAARVGLLGA